MARKIRIGLDIGIGSVGWAVLSHDDRTDPRIEDRGVRLFDSGEDLRKKERYSQQRRAFRSVRRLVRRRAHRRDRLKAQFELMGLVDRATLNAWYEENNPDMFQLRVRALQEKLTGAEIGACLIHISNHRGYKDFFESDGDAVQDAEAKKTREAIDGFNALFTKGNYISAAEVFTQPPFKNPGDNYPFSRNRKERKQHYLVPRKMLEKEVQEILIFQGRFKSQFNPDNNRKIMEIIFTQRDFEDGPGNVDDPWRRFKGFLDNIGKCMYYKDQNRGFRCTLIADLYSVVNALSQYSYVNKETGEISLPKAAANNFLEFLVKNAELKLKDVETMLKPFNVEMVKPSMGKVESIPQAVKFLKTMRKFLEETGYSWSDFAGEDHFDIDKPSRLNLLSSALCQNITPRRRERKLAEMGFNKEFIKRVRNYTFGGTANVSDKYMIEAIEAFRNGESYGNFQARKLSGYSENVAPIDKTKILPQITAQMDEDMVKNPVVYRAINETRKVVNELIRRFGSPEAINIEVASEVSRSFAQRAEIFKNQRDREKDNQKKRCEIAQLFDLTEEKVTGKMIERYRLYELQDGKCLYSGRPIHKEHLMSESYEIDHIVPQSLILDNTLENKALVFSEENQVKLQRVPLEYLQGEQRANFKGWVNDLFRHRKISARKYQYLMLPDLVSPDSVRILEEWKSRNINDTRYITKYLVKYFQDHLVFDSAKNKCVYGIKGSITARFRRIWLNSKTWGAPEKDRTSSHLHHAVDAIIIANLTPAYVEIASDSLKLQDIFKTGGRRETQPYYDYLEACVRKMKRFYGFSEEYTRSLLNKKHRVPSFVPRLSDEVDIIMNDTDETLLRQQAKVFYSDKNFAEKISMPLVSYKPERTYKGTVSADNPIKVRKVGDEYRQLLRKDILTVTKKDLPKVLTRDPNLLTELSKALSGKDETYSIAKYLDEQGLEYFTSSGKPIHKITIEGKTIDAPFSKFISPNNQNVLDVRSYYCIEVYADRRGKIFTRGIRYVDMVRRNKKLLLQCGKPENYEKHVMYLFTNDYIRIFDRTGKEKFSGYFKSVKNIGRSEFYMVEDNKVRGKEDKPISIATSDSVRKYHVDILGKRGGEIRCSAPFLSIEETR